MHDIAGFDLSEHDGILRPLRGHLQAAASKDVPLLLESFTSDGIFVGTDDTEYWSIGALADTLAKSNGWRMSSIDLKIKKVGDHPGVAFFHETLNHEDYGPMRGSGTLVKCPGGEWRIAQYALSVSVPNAALDSKEFLEFLALPQG
ncbi:MAG TPA: nuclear transport factor 2 family protein [Candidatus Paceibacterota bacterium]